MIDSGRTKLLLGILGATLLAAGWFYLGSDDSGPAPGPSLARRGTLDPEAGGGGAAPPPLSAARDAKAPVRTVLILRVAELQRTHGSYSPRRDPWRFVEPPPPPPPKPRQPTAAELAALKAAEEARARLLAEQAAEAARPKPPPFTWTYLGNFGPAVHRIAVFSDGRSIYNAQQGDTLAGKFIVAQIGYESVDIRFVGFPEWPSQRLAVGHGR